MFRITTVWVCVLVVCKVSAFAPVHFVLHDAMLCISLMKEILQAAFSVHGSALSIVSIETLPLDAMKGVDALGIPEIEITNIDPSGIVASSSETLQKLSQQISKQLTEQQLAEKSSALIKGLVDDKLVPLVKEQQRSVVDGFNNYLEANPDLKLSASQYATKFWEENVVLKSKYTIEFLSRSPLAKNTESFIGSIRTFQPPAISLSDATPSIPANLQTLDLGKEVNEKFMAYLDAHPKLKMPASQFVADYYQSDFLPRYESTAQVIRQSPLARGIQQFTSLSSSEVAADLTQSVTQRLQPLTNRLASLGERIVTKLAVEPAVKTFDIVISSSKNIIESVTINSGESEGASVAATATDIDTLTLPKLPSIPANFIPVLPTIEVGDLVSGSQQVFAQSLIALGRAGGRLAAELAEKGSILVQNTAGFTASFTQSLGEVFEDVTTVLPSKTVQLLEQSSAQLPSIAEGVETSGEALQSSIVDLSNNVQRVLQDTADRASQWKFFSDDSHWETGFWEQQIKRLVSTSEQLADPEQRDQVLNSATQTLQSAQQRFVSQYETARDQFQARYRLGTVLNPSQQGGEVDYSRAEQTMHQFNEKVQQLQQQWDSFQRQIQGILDPSFTSTPK